MPISKSEPRLPAAQVLPIPSRIGRYDVIDRLATGGMAEIFVCCERGLAGLERLVVIKRILPHLAVHPQFVEMFLAEARYVARLNHPNVVQIFELGEDQGSPYIAMEYVPGSSLRDVIVTAIEKDMPTALGAAVGIIAQACAGAHVAHELTDPSGRSLGLVHRDISPHNLMVTAEGHVKLLDFGIAKATEAASLDDHTKTGALKGKVHYMAPEQCKQEQLDRRADVFALAVVGWELIAQERLFKRESELDSMQAIVMGELKDLRKIRKDVPTEIVAVLEKALRSRRDERYATADEMRRALLDASARHGLRCDADTVASFVKPLLGDQQHRREADLLAMANEKTQATPVDGSSEATVVEKRSQKAIAPPGMRPGTVSHTELSRRAKVRRPKGKLIAAGLAFVVVIAAAALLYAFRSRIFAPSGPPLVIAWAPIADTEMIRKDVEPFDAYLERALDRRVEIIVADTYEDLQKRLMMGQADVGVLPPTVYVKTKDANKRIEALAIKLVDGSTGSDGMMYVNEETGITSIEQLKGKRFCFTDVLSTTGYILPRAALKKAGVDPDRDVITHMSGNHIAVLRDLASGVCDGGAVFSGGYLAADRAGVPVQRLRQIAITGRSPQDAVCAGPNMSDDDKLKLKAALLAFDGKKAGATEGRVERISGFAPAKESDYDQLRAAIR